MRFLKPKT